MIAKTRIDLKRTAALTALNPRVFCHGYNRVLDGGPSWGLKSIAKAFSESCNAEGEMLIHRGFTRLETRLFDLGIKSVALRESSSQERVENDFKILLYSPLWKLPSQASLRPEKITNHLTLRNLFESNQGLNRQILHLLAGICKNLKSSENATPEIISDLLSVIPREIVITGSKIDPVVENDYSAINMRTRRHGRQKLAKIGRMRHLNTAKISYSNELIAHILDFLAKLDEITATDFSNQAINNLEDKNPELHKALRGFSHEESVEFQNRISRRPLFPISIR